MSSSSEMPRTRSTRELAAIMFSDIAGYTLIMGRDEEKAVRALAEHREVLRSLLPKFSGRLIGEIGDGTLSSFHSALDAVNCAREVQSTLLGDPQLQLRIGIHVGDVLFQDNNVLGDGVNVASRIHALASPGGICISERVYDDIRNKPEIQAKSLGEKTLKNVSHPIKVYAIIDTSSSRVLSGTSGPSRVAAKAIRSARTQTLIISLALVLAAGIGVAIYSRYRPGTSTTLAPSLPESPPLHVDQNIAFCRTSDGVRIAYATVGKAPALPVVEIVGWNSHLERSVEGSTDAQYLQYMGERYLYVRYDGRGSGLSDRGVRDLSLDARVHDLEAVMDALKLRKAALFGDSAGGATAIAYTVRHPERVSRLVLYGSFLRWAQSAEEVKRWQAMITLARSDWGTDTPAYRQMWASLFVPDATPSDVRRFAENERMSMTAEDAAAFLTASLAIDVTALAPKIAVPTLIIHCRGDLVVPFEQGRLGSFHFSSAAIGAVLQKSAGSLTSRGMQPCGRTGFCGSVSQAPWQTRRLPPQIVPDYAFRHSRIASEMHEEAGAPPPRVISSEGLVTPPIAVQGPTPFRPRPPRRPNPDPEPAGSNRSGSTAG